MLCKKCGKELSQDAKFCTACGAPVENEYEAPENENIIPEKISADDTFSTDTPIDIADDDISATDTPIDISDDDISATDTPVEIADEDISATDTPIDIPDDDIFAADTPVETAAEVISSAGTAENAEKTEQKAKEENKSEKEVTADSADTEDAETKTGKTGSKKESSDKKDKDYSGKASGSKLFGAAVISIFAVIFLTVFNISLSVRIGLSSDIVKKQAQSMNYETILTSKVDGNETAAEYIHDILSDSFKERSGVTPANITGFLTAADFGDFVSNKLEDYAGFLINGSVREQPSLSSEEIIEFMLNNRVESTEQLGYRLTDDDYNDIFMSLEDSGIVKDFSIEEWGHETGIRMGFVSLFFSIITIAIFLTIAIVLFIWIAITLDKKGRYIFGFYGNTVLISGILIFLPSIVFIVGAPITAVYTGSAFAYIASQMLLPASLVALCTGAFEIFTGIILKRIKAGLKKKDERSSEASAEKKEKKKSGGK